MTVASIPPQRYHVNIPAQRIDSSQTHASRATTLQTTHDTAKSVAPRALHANASGLAAANPKSHSTVALYVQVLHRNNGVLHKISILILISRTLLVETTF